MLMGSLPFLLVPLHLYVAVISWQEWPGFVSGIEFSVLDALALALYLSLPGGPHPLPFRLSMALYFLAVLLTTLQARVPMAALFYPWQLARMFLVYATVTKGVRADPRVAPSLIKGMAAALIMEAGIAIWQRFGLSIIQVYGTYSAQNQLGLISHLVVFPFFALWLTGPCGWLPPVVVIAGTVIQMLTLSRATLGIGGFAFAIVILLSSVRQWTPRKMLVWLGGATMVVILAPLTLSSFAQRDEVDNTTGSDIARESFKRAAVMILSDYPLGIGSNQYLTVANSEGYDDQAGVVGTQRVSIVHNSYLLVAVENGYIGLIFLIVFLLCPLTTAFCCGWRYRRDQRGDLLLGLGVGLLAVYIHAYFEWVFLDFQTQYILSFALGLVAGLAQRLGYWRPFLKGVHPLGAPTASNPTNEQFFASNSATRNGRTARPAGRSPQLPPKRMYSRQRRH
jgi:O-antigen ligase